MRALERLAGGLWRRASAAPGRRRTGWFGRLAEEQAALRRIATLVARGIPPAELFSAVADEVARLLSTDSAFVAHLETDSSVAILAVGGRDADKFVTGERWQVEPRGPIAAVVRTGRPARTDEFDQASGEVRERIQRSGVQSSVVTPIVVEGHLWGVIVAASRRGPFPVDTERRMLNFTELVATAIANAEARRELEQVAVEQAAVSRLAKLVAEAVPSTEIFAAVVSEIAGLLELPRVALFRFGPDRTASVLASSEDDLAPALFEGWSLPADDPGMLASLLGTGRPVRIDGYAEVGGAAGELARELGLGSAVGVPVIVDGRIWGAVTVGLAPGQPPLPGDTVERLTAFTDLVATAISNAVAQTEIDRLAHEQAALRRVATLVARGTPPEEVFAAVAEEVGRLLGVALAGIGRYDSPDTVTVVATWAAEDEHGAHPLVPGPWPLEGGDLASTIARTGRSVRIDDYHGVPGRIAAFVRDELGVVSSVATPVVVEGRLWGTLFVHSKQTHGPLPRDTESRLTGFTELVATAIANTESRAELASSRARIVTTSDDTRRRIERDLHDGVQQRLVTLGLVLRTAQAELPRGLEKVSTELSQVGEGLKAALDELREIARGIHPAILSEKGLAPALKSLARRSPTPVALDVRVEGRLPDGVEVAAYYIVSEMLTNTAKHAQASAVYVDVARADDVLHISVRDDGVGGADPARGSGLVGLRDRVEALGGTIAFQSAKGAGTAVEVMLPLDRTGEASEQVQDASLPQVTGDPH